VDNCRENLRILEIFFQALLEEMIITFLLYLLEQQNVQYSPLLRITNNVALSGCVDIFWNYAIGKKFFVPQNVEYDK